jgi:hypothetical protein
MQSQAYGISYGVSHPNLGGQNNGGTNVVSSASSSDDEADKNASGKRKRPMSVSYAQMYLAEWPTPDSLLIQMRAM